MVQTGAKGVRAQFADAAAKLARETAIDDPSPYTLREGYAAGLWPGAPFDRLPPNCPVTPLGVNGKTTFFICSMGQLMAFDQLKPADLIKLFRAAPNYLYWAWPRKSKIKDQDGNDGFIINAVEEKKAIMCLEKAASRRGLFDPANRVRGRGAWTDRSGRLIWHSGEALWRVDGGRLKQSPTGELDDIYYPRRPAIMTPWQEPVDPSDSPAPAILAALKSWSFERGLLDALIVLGHVGTMLIGGALPWRPHLAAMGDKGVGKSQLNALLKAVMGSALIDAANTTEAGLRQHVELDALPIAIDEFEASEDNRRVVAIIELARYASSGGRMFRGGQDHKGVEFTARSAFFASGINLPPMKPQDLTRFVVLNLGKLSTGGAAPPVIQEEWGRMLLRALMDAWPRFHATFADWRAVLRAAGINDRGQDTYGTLLAIAQLLLGAESLEELGLPVTEARALGAMLAAATADERAEAIDNWRAALEHLIASPVEMMHGGQRLTLGAAIEALQAPSAAGMDETQAKDAARLAGCKLVLEADATLPHGRARVLLAVPPKGPLLERIFRDTRWNGAGWYRALKQAPPDIAIRDRGNKQVHKINGSVERCLLVDLTAYDTFTSTPTEPHA